MDLDLRSRTVGTFIVACLALAVWYGSGYVGMEAVNRHAQGMADSVRRREPFVGDLYQSLLQLFLAIGLFVLGTSMMAAVLSTGQVVAMVFGVGSLVTAYQTNKRTKSLRGSQALRLVVLLSLMLAGCLILAFGL